MGDSSGFIRQRDYLSIFWRHHKKIRAQKIFIVRLISPSSTLGADNFCQINLDALRTEIYSWLCNRHCNNSNIILFNIFLYKFSIYFYRVLQYTTVK